MKIKQTAPILLLFCTILSGCGTKMPAGIPAEDTVLMYEEYQELLRRLHDHGVLPGRPEDPLPEGINIEENQFAIYDVDADGRDELILIYDPGWVAGMLEIVYDYSFEEQTVREQNVFFPGTHFYSGGFLYDVASHNQGVAGRFWPFRLCQYNPSDDEYHVIASVDAWDGEYAPVREADGEEFPSEADEDGNGMVYYIYDVYKNENGIISDIENDSAMDDDAYQEWLTSVMGDAEELTLPFQPLTTENIENICKENNLCR